MADIRPFKAVKPARGLESKIAALPYDVYNRQEAKAEVQGKKLSFLNIDRPETQFADDYDMYSDEVYAMAKTLYESMKADGNYVMDETSHYYIYELTMDGRTQTGIVACASVDDYIDGTIKKHENTRAEKEADRIRHVDTMSAQSGPIFLAYRSNDVINGIVNKVMQSDADYDFTSEDGIRHRGWTIGEEFEADILDAFANISEIYIADGHHRCASAAKVGLKRRENNPNYTGQEEFNYFLSILFPDEQLMIMDYNRVIKDLNGHSEDEIIDFLNSKGVLTEIGAEQYKPSCKGTVGIFFNDKWYEYKFNSELISDDPVKGLDVSILQDAVLEPLFDIKDPKTDNRIDFVGGIRGLKELERRCHLDGKIAFAMYPTSIGELFDVADNNMLMPPKSTWFEPKLRSGLYIHEID